MVGGGPGHRLLDEVAALARRLAVDRLGRRTIQRRERPHPRSERPAPGLFARQGHVLERLRGQPLCRVQPHDRRVPGDLFRGGRHITVCRCQARDVRRNRGSGVRALPGEWHLHHGHDVRRFDRQLFLGLAPGPGRRDGLRRERSNRRARRRPDPALDALHGERCDERRLQRPERNVVPRVARPAHVGGWRVRDLRGGRAERRIRHHEHRRQGELLPEDRGQLRRQAMDDGDGQ